jgi:DNA polymerase-1
MSGDPALLEAVRQEDVHRGIAAILFAKPPADVTDQERRLSKTFVFGCLLYGQSIESAARMHRLPESAIRRIRDDFRARFPKASYWSSEYIINVARKRPHIVRTPWGRCRQLLDIMSLDDGVRGHAERQAMNAPIQAMASDVTQYGNLRVLEMLRSAQERYAGVKFWGTVHDSLIYEIPAYLLKRRTAECGKITYTGKILRLITKELTAPMPVIKDCPLVVDCTVGERWGGKPSVRKILEDVDALFNIHDVSAEAEFEEDEEEA